jgi:hypothetical protein
MFPYIFQANYETGDFSQFASATNPGQMVAEHYAAMVQKNVGEVPYRGAYAQHHDLTLGTANAFVVTPAITGGGAVRFMLYVSADLRMGLGANITLARVDCGADQTILLLENSTGTPRLNVQGAYAVAQRTAGLTLGQWHCIEYVTSGVDMQLYMNGGAVGAPLTPLASPVITEARLGTMSFVAGTYAGHIAFDQVVVDDLRIYGLPERYPQIITVTSSGVVIPGSGRYERFNVIAGHDTDNVIDLYDSDVAVHPLETPLAPTLTSAIANREFHLSKRAGYFQYGLKVVMTGTNPQAVIVLGHALCSAGAIAEWARRRPAMRVA